MFMKIGDLAKHTGLTVRTLHHYHDIGLLTPSIRSDAGYRLYDKSDVARLHKIQALKQFGFSLSDIGNLLAGDGTSMPDIIAQQLQHLARQKQEAERLTRHLQALQAQLHGGMEPSLADWLTTLELMTMYDKYFTPAELAELDHNRSRAQDDIDTRWPQMVAAVRALMDAKVAPQQPEARQLALQWMTMVQKLVGGNANLLIKLDTMTRQEPGMQQQSGIDPDMLAYLGAARFAAQNALFAKYLGPEQLAIVARQREQHGMKWPALIAAVRNAMNQGLSQDTPQVQDLARQWQAQGLAMADGDQAIRAGLRLAYQNEPDLMLGSGMDAALVAFIQDAMARLESTTG